MGKQSPPPNDIRLAVALAACDPDRRVLPDRRSGLDRRKRVVPVPAERRSGHDRRQTARRAGETRATGLVRRALEARSARARGPRWARFAAKPPKE
jgi:hypothetical protein